MGIFVIQRDSYEGQKRGERGVYSDEMLPPTAKKRSCFTREKFATETMGHSRCSRVFFFQEKKKKRKAREPCSGADQGGKETRWNWNIYTRLKYNAIQICIRSEVASSMVKFMTRVL